MAYRVLFLESLAELRQSRGNGSGKAIAYVVTMEEGTHMEHLTCYIWFDGIDTPADNWDVVIPFDGGVGRWKRVPLLTVGPTGPQGIQGIAGNDGATGANGSNGTNGTNGINGIDGISVFSAPTSRSLSLSTAYQATNPAKPAIVVITLQSTSSISLAGAVNNEGIIYIGNTNAVASGTGSAVGQYKNNLGGTLVIGLNLNNQQAQTTTFALPANWYFAVRQTSGSGLTIVSAFDQQSG